jgi:hypothetical protein
MSITLEESRTVALAVEEAFDRVLPMPLEELFVRRYGPIPAIKKTRQDGVWGTVGQRRTIELADPGTMQEELTVVERPQRFGYRISGVTGPMKLLVSHVEGTWTFELDALPTGEGGTRITWRWVVHPANSVGRLAMPVFGRLWHGYARRSLAHLETLLTSPRRS